MHLEQQTIFPRCQPISRVGNGDLFSLAAAEPNASPRPTFICAGVAPLSLSGFAGLWSAAARRRDELCISPGEVEILVVNRTPSHGIRVRKYEAELSEVLVPLGGARDLIGVKHIASDVIDIDVPDNRRWPNLHHFRAIPLISSRPRYGAM
ncbi:MAG: NADH dehydrogenase-like protein [Beijerinckiaceae bacterium]|nr:MAG: NADH dehydrogenase-like protein [Beijerinckiaceae bacterium]